MKKFTCLATGIILMTAASSSFSQGYPSQPIKLIVPFAPGGSTDMLARIISEPLSRHLGQTVVIENKPGAGGLIGTQDVMRASPDGYTLAMATPSTTAANPAINPNVKYRPSDFTALGNIASTPNVIAVNPNFPAKTYSEFVAELKRHPEKYSYASSGTGGILHLQMESFKGLTGTSITHVPYRGAGPALNDTIAGQTQIVFDSLPSAYPFIKSGLLVPIVIAAPERVKVLPDTPTFAEVGLPAMNRMSYFGIIGPKGMPKDLVSQINLAIRTSSKEPRASQSIESSGSIVADETAEQFSSEIDNEFALLKKVVKEQNLRLD